MKPEALPSQPIDPVRLIGPVVIDLGAMADHSEEVERILSLLDKLIAFQRVQIRDVEAAMGVKQGYIARLFRGGINFRYDHVLAILDAIGISPRQFFQFAYAPDGGGDDELRRLVGKPSLPEPSDSLVTLRQADLEKLVLTTLQKLDLIKKPVATARPKRRPRSRKD